MHPRKTNRTFVTTKNATTASVMKYDVFISYSSYDQKVAEGVCAYLEQHRIRCFVAYRDIPKGVVWARAIVEALEESRMMVIVFSENFNRSEQVDREIELASEDHMPILTFRIADDAFRGAKKYYLKNLNWIDAFPQPERCFGELCKNVKQLLGIDEEKETSEPEDAQTLYERGESYYYGEGVTQDYAEAVRWYRKAAELGHAQAQNDLGYCYDNGQGVSQNHTEAAKWYRKAAEQGYDAAQYNLGCCYEDGKGVTKNLAEAVRWYRKAAEQGDDAAQNSLGYCYFNGDGVPQNSTEAAKWFRKAAEQGYAAAQYNLGFCYNNGEGVAENYAEAVKWFRKAAKQGNKDALEALKELGENL